MRSEAREWLNQAKYSLQDARALLRSRRYLFASYACQLAIEKALKAVIVERTAAPPPKIHNLTELVKIGQAPLTKEQTEFVATLNMAAIGTRYPETLSEAIKQYPKRVVNDYVRKAGEIIQCLENAPPLKK